MVALLRAGYPNFSKNIGAIYVARYTMIRGKRRIASARAFSDTLP
jgi:hypothetical protein